MGGTISLTGHLPNFDHNTGEMTSDPDDNIPNNSDDDPGKKKKKKKKKDKDPKPKPGDLTGEGNEGNLDDKFFDDAEDILNGAIDDLEEDKGLLDKILDLFSHIDILGDSEVPTGISETPYCTSDIDCMKESADMLQELLDMKRKGMEHTHDLHHTIPREILGQLPPMFLMTLE